MIDFIMVHLNLSDDSHIVKVSDIEYVTVDRRCRSNFGKTVIQTKAEIISVSESVEEIYEKILECQPPIFIPIDGQEVK